MMRVGSIVVALACLAGCNTVNGMGQDLEAAGRAVSNGAQTVERAVFDQDSRQPAQTDFRTRAGEACDPSPDAVAGGPGLPPCRVAAPVPSRQR